MTPGQAAYEAYCGIATTWRMPWQDLSNAEWRAWESAAKAAMTERAACELVERLLRELDVSEVCPVRGAVACSMFEPGSKVLIEITADSLASAIERARAARSGR